METLTALQAERVAAKKAGTWQLGSDEANAWYEQWRAAQDVVRSEADEAIKTIIENKKSRGRKA